MTQLYNMIV